MNTAKYGRKLPVALAIALPLMGAGLDAQDHPFSLRGLTGDAGMVLRGAVLDQARALFQQRRQVQIAARDRGRIAPDLVGQLGDASLQF